MIAIGVLFWLLMIFWFVLGIIFTWPSAPTTPLGFRPVGNHFLIFIVICILGWKVFGPPFHG